MADTLDSKPSAQSMRVQVPPSAPDLKKDYIQMKMAAIVTMVFLSACATGVSDPIDDSVEETPETNSAPNPSPTPAPSVPDCEVDAYWSGNCLIKKVYCHGQFKRIDVMCDRGRELFPWEYIPDPPFNGAR